MYCDRWGITTGIYCCLLPYCIWLRGSHCNAGIRRGKAISEFRKPEGPPPAPPPSWARKPVLHLRCVTQLTLVCILRYSGCSSLPIQSSVCYDIQNGSLCRSSFLYATLFQNASLCLSGVLYATLFKILPFTNLIPIRFKKLPTTRTGRHSARLRPSAGFFSSFRSECTAEAQDTGWLCFCRRGVLLRCQPPTKPQTGQYPEPRRPVSHQTRPITNNLPQKPTLSAIQRCADGSTTFKFNKKETAHPCSLLMLLIQFFVRSSRNYPCRQSSCKSQT